MVNQIRKEEKKAEKSQQVARISNRVTRTVGRHGAHGVTKVVLFVGTRRGSDNGTCGSESLCRSRSNDAGTAELRAESDDVDERIGDALFRTSGR